MKLKNIIIIVIVFCFVYCEFICADSVLVFNEIMYHPATNETAMEWVELYNQMAVNLDISGWGLQGGIDYSFPEGTIVKAGEYIVIASSPEILEHSTGITDVYGPYPSYCSYDFWGYCCSGE